MQLHYSSSSYCELRTLTIDIELKVFVAEFDFHKQNS